MKKPIIIYGAGRVAEKFYCLNYDRYDIHFLIDRMAGAGRTFHGLPVLRLGEAFKRWKGEMIVIATDRDDTYAEIRNILIEVGLEEDKDFIPLSHFDKQLAILYGNCHIGVIEDYLIHVPEFSDKYYIKSYFLVGEKENIRWPSDTELEECGLLVTYDIREENRKGAPGADELLGKLTNGIGVKVPNLYGRNLFYPQINEIDTESEKLHVGNNAFVTDRFVSDFRWVIGWRDKNIERMLMSEVDIPEIVQYIIEADVYDKDEIIDNFRVEIEKIKHREENCDIHISDYILDNYKTMLTYHDPCHPSKEVLHEIAHRVCEAIGVNGRYTGIGGVASDHAELFIYGCVKRALGMEFEQEYIKRYNSSCTLHGRAINLREYIEEYKKWHYPIDGKK